MTHNAIRLLCAQSIFFGAFLAPALASAQSTLTYRVEYPAPGSERVRIEISLPRPQPAPLAIIVPRAIPGGYVQRYYDAYVNHVEALSPQGDSLQISRGEGPRWILGAPGAQVARIAYEVNLAQMEREILDASDTSRVRPAYASLLGYTLFAFLDGHEDEPIALEVRAPAGWPVFTTLEPRAPPVPTSATARATNFYMLADSQIVMGPALQVRRFEGSVPLYLALYSEGESDPALEGRVALEALEKVAAYFGKPFFAHYTVLVEYLRPISSRHAYLMSMEHLESGTFYLTPDRALTARGSPSLRELNLFNYAHHIAHSWVPKHAYGTGYMPHRWEILPLIDTIWFNEGFGRYAAIEALADGMPAAEGKAFRERQLDLPRQILAAAPEIIRRMSLVELSRVASFIYADDWRTGRNTFSRGALMAAEMDARIRERTGGAKRLRDALRYLLAWCARNPRGFQIEEFPGLIAEATGVDVRDIYNRWLAPPAQ